MVNDKQLDSGIDTEKQKLKDAIETDDTDDLSVLGYGVMYTVGADWNCIVPRDWLLDRVNDLGIPRWLAPSEPSPHYAYDRAIKWMREDWIEPYVIEAPRMDTGVEENHRVQVKLREGDGSRIWHAYAEVFFDEEESGQQGGTWSRHHLGQFWYDSDAGVLRATQDDELTTDNHLHAVWEDIETGAERLHQRMLKAHIAQDIRKMMYNTVTKYTTNVIKLRRSVYLFPAGMGEFVESMAQLYAEIDENWKETGEPVAVRTFEVLDTDDKQDWIQHQVQATLMDNLDTVLDGAFSQFDGGEAADQVVKIIRQNLGDTVETAETYNAILEAEISIEEALDRQKANLTDEDKRDILDRVTAQTDVDAF